MSPDARFATHVPAQQQHYVKDNVVFATPSPPNMPAEPWQHNHQQQQQLNQHHANQQHNSSGVGHHDYVSSHMTSSQDGNNNGNNSNNNNGGNISNQLSHSGTGGMLNS
eukprot:c15780_g1_i5.p1 GENE.c15780_g1_i5~~c15780_g1_i5.p1  ORF type:complete len:119 (-),score=28.19 c15780_g1_i5:223-549(-)